MLNNWNDWNWLHSKAKLAFHLVNERPAYNRDCLTKAVRICKGI